MIAVVGDVMLDRYWHCSQEQGKPNPERPGGIAYAVHETFALGGAAAVARLARHLNGDVTLYGVIGNDDAGKMIGEMCDKSSIQYVLGKTMPRTTIKTRLVIDGQLQDNRFDADNRGGILSLAGIEDAQVVVIQDYKKGAVCRSLIEDIIARNPDAVMIVDPALGVDPRMYHGADIIKANHAEADAWVKCGYGKTTTDAVRRVADKLSCSVVVTMGERGLVIVPDNNFVQAVKVDHVVDVCGAGDTIAAALAVKIAGNATLLEACQFAVECAAIQIQGIGCNPVDLKQGTSICSQEL